MRQGPLATCPRAVLHLRAPSATPALYTVAQNAKDAGSLPSNIRQATSQAASREGCSMLSTSTSHSWNRRGSQGVPRSWPPRATL